MKIKTILCIDDSPERYMKLSRIADKEGIFVAVTHNLESVNYYLDNGYNIIGICLDHDMPGQNGTYYAEHVLPDYIPVIITSFNPVGAQNISNILKKKDFKAWERMSPSGSEWSERALDFFKKFGTEE